MPCPIEAPEQRLCPSYERDKWGYETDHENHQRRVRAVRDAARGQELDVRAWHGLDLARLACAHRLRQRPCRPRLCELVPAHGLDLRVAPARARALQTARPWQ